MDPREEPGSAPAGLGNGGISIFFVVVGTGLALYGRSLIVGGGDDVEFGWSMVLAGAILGLPGLVAAFLNHRMLRRARAEHELFARGRRAVAVVEGVRTTWLMVNDDRQIVLRLRVQPRGEPGFAYERRMFVPSDTLPRPGDEIEVAYDPADPSRVALATDWHDPAVGQLRFFRRPDAGEGPAAGESVVEQLERLERLRQSGSLTFSEFEELKAKLLSGREG